METDAVRPWHRHALNALVAVGVLLRLWQYLGNTSLWTDEISLAENVIHRPVGRLLLAPLDFDQVAPAGFLLVTKAVATLLGPSELALRLFPLVCSLAGLWLFRRLAGRVLAGWTLLFAMGLFATGGPLILYAAEVKQYSGDVAVSLLLTLIAFDLRESAPPPARFLRAGLTGLVVVWFSQAAVLVLAGLGGALVLFALLGRERRAWRNLAATLLPWTVGAAAAVWSGHRTITPEMHAYLYRFWSNGFWPLPPRNPRDLLWLPKNLRGFWGQSLFDYPLSVLYLALMILGFWALWRRRRDAALLLLGPVAAMLAASAARQYPFQGRLLLVLVPAFLLAASEGAGVLAARLPLPAPASVALLAIPPLLALVDNLPVVRLEETRPMLAYVAEHRRPEDAIYVYYGAEPAFRYYGPRYGLDRADAVVGGCHRSDPRAYLREIDAFRGRPRVWVIFAHDVPRLGEQAAILGYLGRIGVRRDAIDVPDDGPSDTRAELYDLGIPEHLAAASAETFPLPELDEELAQRLGCDQGPLRTTAPVTRRDPRPRSPPRAPGRRRRRRARRPPRRRPSAASS